MTCYIESNAKPINATTFASIEDAIAFATAPSWAGAQPNEITMTGATSYTHRGAAYSIVSGENPTGARQAAKAAVTKAPSAKAAFAKIDTRNPNWLSREMDRADSNF